MIESTPAPRYIQATDELLKGWRGTVHLATDSVPYIAASRFSRDDGLTGYECASCTHPSVTLCAVAENMRLDPTRREVLHHLVDRLAIPEWVRGLPREVGAFCCVVGAATGWPVRVRKPWTLFDDGRWTRGSYGAVGTPCVAWDVPSRRGLGWKFEADDGPETGDAGKEAADRAALAAGCILDNGDHLLGPGPGGVVWRWELNKEDR